MNTQSTKPNRKTRRNNKRNNRSQATYTRHLKINRHINPLNDQISNAKWSVMERSVTNPNTVPRIATLSPLIIQGLQANQRIGDKIFLTQANFTYSITAGDNYNLVRVILLRVVGTPPSPITMGDFFDNGPSLAPDVYSQTYPYVHGKTYMVMYDRTDVVCSASPNLTVHREFSVPLNFEIDYSASTNVSRAGDLVLITLSDSALAPNPQLNANLVVWYRDL